MQPTKTGMHCYKCSIWYVIAVCTLTSTNAMSISTSMWWCGGWIHYSGLSFVNKGWRGALILEIARTFDLYTKPAFLVWKKLPCIWPQACECAGSCLAGFNTCICWIHFSRPPHYLLSIPKCILQVWKEISWKVLLTCAWVKLGFVNGHGLMDGWKGEEVSRII